MSEEELTDDFVFIQSATELQQVLSGGFSNFKTWLSKIKENYQ